MSNLKKISVSKSYQIFAIIFASFSVVLVIFFSSVHIWLINFAYTNLNPLGSIYNNSHSLLLKFILLFCITVGFLLSIVLWKRLHLRFFKLLSDIFDYEKITKVLFLDPLIPKRNFSKIIFVIGTGTGIISHVIGLLAGRMRIEGGEKVEPLTEHISHLLLVFSAIIFLTSIFKVKKSRITKIERRIIKIWLLVISLFVLFVLFEEISWGQQYFQWESTGFFKNSNFQKETNLHNIINPLFKFIYPLVGMGSFILLFLIWFFYRGKKPYWLELLTPHQSLIWLSFIIACSSFFGDNEVFEILLYVFILLYSVRIFTCLNYSNKPI